MKKRVTIEFRGTAEPLGRKNISQDFDGITKNTYYSDPHVYQVAGTDQAGREVSISAPIDAILYVHVTDIEASTGQTEHAP